MSISSLVKTVAIEMLKDSAIHLEVDLQTDLYNVAIDEGQMKQVVINLVANAKEAMPKGGKLIIRGENLDVSVQDSLPIREGKYVKISFIDTGAGVPNTDFAIIFDPYFSTKDTYSQKGLGLSLAVCYSIIIKHEGLITVESEIGKGTTFHIFLPGIE